MECLQYSLQFTIKYTQKINNNNQSINSDLCCSKCRLLSLVFHDSMSYLTHALCKSHWRMRDVSPQEALVHV